MWKTLQQWWRRHFAPAGGRADDTTAERVQVATAALMIEAVRADFERDPRQVQALRRGLREHLGIEDAKAGELLARAQAEVAEAVGVFGFTRVLADTLERDRKVALLRALWRLVYANGRKDPLEEQYMRRVTDLLVLTHADFVHTRIDVEREIGDRGGSPRPGGEG